MTGILAGLIGSIKKAFGWTIGTVTTLIYQAGVYAPLSGGSYFAFAGGSTTSYRYSSDGVNWSSGTLPSASGIQGAATNGSRIVIGRGSNASGYYSDNGTSWTSTGSYGGGSGNYHLMRWDGTRFLVSSATLNNLSYATSANVGSTWSTASFSTASLQALDIGYDGTSRHIVTYNSATSSARTTTTFPNTWSTITFPTAGWWISPIFGNSIWVVMRAGSSSYATSTNGTTWTNRTLPSNFSETTGDVYANCVFNDGKFWYYYTNNVYSSTDGINWTTEATVTGGALDNGNGWAVGGGKYCVFGYDTTGAGSGSYLLGQ